MCTYEEVKNCLVKVLCSLDGNDLSTKGMGFFATPGGHILTCWHVISPDKKNIYPQIQVQWNNNPPILATWLEDLTNPEQDIAVLQAEREDTPSINFSEEFEPFDRLLVWNMYDDRFDGLPVSAQMLIKTQIAQSFRDVLLIRDTKMKKGFSGSPLFDHDSGTVIGIISAKIGEGTEALAIPIERVIDRFPKLRRQYNWINQFLQVSKYEYNAWKQSLFFKDYFDLEVNPDQMFLVPQEQDILSKKRKFEKYSVLQAIQEFSPLIIVGEPGSGKTTALREISRQYIHNYAKTHDHSILPIYVPIVQITEKEKHNSLSIVISLLEKAFNRLKPYWNFSGGDFLDLMQKKDFIFRVWLRYNVDKNSFRTYIREDVKET